MLWCNILKLIFSMYFSSELRSDENEHSYYLIEYLHSDENEHSYHLIEYLHEQLHVYLIFIIAT